ncbi:MAG: hypothetical protein ACLTWG_08755 [Blautia sp.]|uniref:hypothetical protein n=1 Tax=Blautia sp. TaxID=1955243 RepID=UPI003993FB0A
MKQNVIIRKEIEKDYEIVEKITRQAFYNIIYMPGCMEHYLIRIMKEHGDFITQFYSRSIHQNEYCGCLLFYII